MQKWEALFVKKHFMRFMSMILALVLVFSNVPAVFAMEYHPEAVSVTVPAQANPLYDGQSTETTTYSRRLYSAGETYEDIAAKCTDDYAQIVSALTEGMENRDAQIALYFSSEEPLYTQEEVDNLDNKAFSALLNQRWLAPLFEDALEEADSPTQGDYLRWAWSGKGCGFFGFYDYDLEKYCYKTTFSMTYYTTKAQEEELTEAINTLVENFHFTPGTTDSQKIAAIYDYITNNIAYDYKNLNDGSYTLKYTAYAALINKTAVCQGFALLYYRLAEMCGVDTRVICGYSGGDHAWNISKLGEKYYNLDCTWDAGRKNYNYFLKGSTDYPDHSAFADYTTPAFLEKYPLAKKAYSADPTVNPEAANFTYRVKKGNTTITGYTGSAQHLVIPAKLGNGTVTAIGENVFANNSSLITVTIPETVKAIGSGAFRNCSSLTDVYYIAQRSLWEKVSIGKDNSCLENAVFHYSEKCAHTYTNACDANCNNCNAVRQVSHNYTAATCTKAKTCTLCNQTDGSALGHKYVSATCTKANTCTRCKATKGKALGHSYDNACDSKCNRCDAKRSVTHKYTAKTCGKTTKCSVCGKKGGKLAHSYTNACDTKCNRCGNKRTIKHDYENKTTKATMKKNGKVVKACSVCGKVSSTTTVYKIKSVKLSTTKYTYNGKKKTPTVTVKDSKGNKLKKDTDYTVSYDSGRKKVGEYEVTVKFKGKYSGTEDLEFKIVPKESSIKKLTAKSKALEVKINRQTTQATGYQIEYSTSKSFKSSKKVTISDENTSKTTIKGLKKKKTYYVRIRTYKTVDGKKFYSAWSSYKSMKTK